MLGYNEEDDVETIEMLTKGIIKAVLDIHDETVAGHVYEMQQKDQEIRELKDKLTDLENKIKELGGAE